MKKLVLLLCLLIPAALQAQDQDIPREVIAWIESEIAKCDTPPVGDLHSFQEFFSNEKNARLVGYIKGYDPQAGYSSGSINHHNMITGENLVSVIEIHPDGRFSSDVLLSSPTCIYAKINRKLIELYLEPGQTLGIILDCEELLKSDWEVRPTAYYGPLATVNKEFNEYKIPYWQKCNITDPGEFKKYFLARWKSQSDDLDILIETNAISPKSADILSAQIISSNVLALLDYIYLLDIHNQGNEEVARRIDSIQRNGYYDFLRNDFMDDPAFLIPYTSSPLINRYEFAQHPYEISNKLRKMQKTFYEYLTEDLNLNISPEDADYFNSVEINRIDRTSDPELRDALLQAYNKKNEEYNKKYEKEYDDYFDKYSPPEISELEIHKLELRLRDSTNKNLFHLEPNLICDIVKIHDLQGAMGNSSREEARELATYAAFGFAHPFIAAWAERLYNEKFPSDGSADSAYELPEGKATEIFKRIIDPFRGKILIVDFWGTSCGPCVGEIQDSKKSREEWKDDRIAFIYITDNSNSPRIADYDRFVAANFMPNSYRISNDEWNYLAQLFGISGIPHMTLITPDGRVAEKRFRTHYANFYFEQLIAKYFPTE